MFSPTTDSIFFSTDGADELPKLVEDIIRTSINTGPRGAFRLAQGIQAVISVGGEWLADISKVMVFSIISPLPFSCILISRLHMFMSVDGPYNLCS